MQLGMSFRQRRRLNQGLAARKLFSIIYRTGTGKEYPLEIGYGELKSDLLRVDQEATTEACRSGCNLYSKNGGCPPFAPNFTAVCGKQILIAYAKIHTRHYPLKVLNGPYYTRWVFVETFMTSLTNRLGKTLADYFGGYFLSSGNCHSCRPKRCAVKEGEKCRNPPARTYSLEATGVLVTHLMKSFFETELQWWKMKEPSSVPDYMLKVVGVTKDGSFDGDRLNNCIQAFFDKSGIKYLSEIS